MDDPLTFEAFDLPAGSLEEVRRERRGVIGRGMWVDEEMELFQALYLSMSDAYARNDDDIFLARFNFDGCLSGSIEHMIAAKAQAWTDQKISYVAVDVFVVECVWLFDRCVRVCYIFI